MKIGLALTVSLLALIVSPLEALNLGYLPGDTSFRVSYSKETWQELISKPEKDALELEYWYPGGMLCGVAGQWTLKFKEMPAVLSQAVQRTLQDDRFWKLTGDGEFTMDGPVFFFVSPDFDLAKHSLMHRDNPNFLEILAKYPDGRYSIEQHPDRYENPKASQTNNAPEFGALPPFPLEQESFGKEYAPEVVAPAAFKVIVIADAYDTLLEEVRGEANGAKTIAFSFTTAGLEKFSYSDGVWKRTTQRTEQGDDAN